MSQSEKLIRWSAILAVTAVAAVAGWVSYVHAHDVVTSHGEAGALGYAYPGTVDGLIFAASMVLLDAARRKVPAPALAYWALGLGISVTLFANVLAGWQSGWLGAFWAAWPAVALVVAYETLMLLVRRTATPAVATETAEIPQFDPPASQSDAIRAAIAETGSNDPSVVVAYLADRGIVVARQRVCDVIRRDRARVAGLR